MNKKLLYLVLTITALALVLALSACGKNTNNNGGTNVTPSPTAVGGGAGQTKDITVSATNFEFDQKDIKLKVGDTVKLTLKNVNGNHGLQIPGLNVNINNGETATFTVTEAGVFDYNCSIQCGAGHKDMVGKITVS